MKIRLGPPATGSNFYPRPALREKLLRALERGNVAFIGPRRTGKTSILEEIHRHPPEGTRVVLLDLEKFDNVKDWLLAMVRKTREELGTPSQKGRLSKAANFAAEQLQRLEKLEVMSVGIQLSKDKSTPEAWRPCAEEFAAFIQNSGERIYFLLDEFPWFLAHIAKKHTHAEVEALMNWFRGIRQEMADAPVRFLLTGSIGLEGYLRRIGLSPSANDLDTIEIPPLSDTEADDLLARLADGEEVPLTSGNRKQIRDLLGANWPILLELFVAEIQDASLGKSPTKAELTRIYREHLVKGSRNAYCKEMFDRIDKPELFDLAQRNLAKRILLTLVEREELSSQDAEIIHEELVPSTNVRQAMPGDATFVLDTLRHDGYIARLDGGSFRFASHMLRDFWRHRGGR
jgi:hypothetical protein